MQDIAVREARQLVQVTFDEILAAEPYAGIPVRPVAECPSPPYFIRSGERAGGTQDPPGNPTPLETLPSPYLLTVALTTPERIASIFAERPSHVSVEESICLGHHCFGVTASVYLDDREMRDPELRLRRIREALSGR
ncbi:MAG: hypothetical protein H0U00_11030 [Actinobacteria bacterium]|nr:hypothetical protein [Actinomycetota bacterium]